MWFGGYFNPDLERVEMSHAKCLVTSFFRFQKPSKNFFTRECTTSPPPLSIQFGTDWFSTTRRCKVFLVLWTTNYILLPVWTSGIVTCLEWFRPYSLQLLHKRISYILLAYTPVVTSSLVGHGSRCFAICDPPFLSLYQTTRYREGACQLIVWNLECRSLEREWALVREVIVLNDYGSRLVSNQPGPPKYLHTPHWTIVSMPTGSRKQFRGVLLRCYGIQLVILGRDSDYTLAIAIQGISFLYSLSRENLKDVVILIV